MKLRTMLLAGTALDYAVALTQRLKLLPGDPDDTPPNRGEVMFDVRESFPTKLVLGVGGWDTRLYCPSDNWDQGGPLIEKYQINLTKTDDCLKWHGEMFLGRTKIWQMGYSPLYAAMRVLVSAYFGDEIEMPGELETEVRAIAEWPVTLMPDYAREVVAGRQPMSFYFPEGFHKHRIELEEP